MVGSFGMGREPLRCGENLASCGDLSVFIFEIELQLIL
jgi:hypothetical protein